MTTPADLSDSESAFAARAIRRRPLFLGLALFGVVVAVGLAGFYAWRFHTDPAFPIGPRMVIVLLVLLNARQNLRQYRYATVMEKALRAATAGGSATGGGPAAAV